MKSSKTVKTHKHHRMDPASIESDKKQTAERKHKKRAEQIIEQLRVLEKATLLMMAKEIGCQSSDLTKALLNLRVQGDVVDAGMFEDPISGNLVHFWALKSAGAP
jgi:hypothetical protein